MTTVMTPHTRVTPREIGTAGIMLHLTKPAIIKQQLEALKALGLLPQALEIIETHNPVLAAAAANNLEHYLDWNAIEETPREYSYGGDNGDSFISSEYTWVAKLAYELQTLALYSLMDTLETGELAPEQPELYAAALADSPDSYMGILAFNFNPHRQPEGFFVKLAQRFDSAGFSAKRDSHGVTNFTVPAFFWNALSQNARIRFASHIVYNGIASPETFSALKETRGVQGNFSKALAQVFAPEGSNGALNLDSNEPHTFFFDNQERFSRGRILITPTGFRWVESYGGLTSESPVSLGV